MKNKFPKIPEPEAKHYKRPPIRFLLLIVRALNKYTGFGKGVFSVEEFTINVRMKEETLNFFKKWKVYTQLLVGHDIDVDEHEIALGREVNKTLVFLQCLAEGAQHPKISFSKAAAKVTGQPEPAEEVDQKESYEKESQRQELKKEQEDVVRKPDAPKINQEDVVREPDTPKINQEVKTENPHNNNNNKK